jgi:neutral ceramidase
MRPLRAALLATLVLLVLGSLVADAKRPNVGSRRRHHHQGESLAKPTDFMRGVLEERFKSKHADSIPELRQHGAAGQYNVGAGIYDVTGQIAEIGFMGYAVPGQVGGGIQLRQRARAFVFVDANSGARVVYISIDMCMGFQMVKLGVIDRLQDMFGPTMYTHANVMISGTHTHATPGGVGGTALVDITTFGFSKENYAAAVEGIFQAIVNAHNNVQPATIKVNVGQCDGCNINRSPSAYLLDPDRNQYPNNTDHAMSVLRIENSETGAEIGMVSWFAVHGQSLVPTR